MTTKNKAERKKRFIRIGALVVAGVMAFTIILTMIIK